MQKINSKKIDKSQFIINIDKNSRIPAHITIDNKDYVIISKNEYKKMQEIIKNSNDKIINSVLEKEILKEMPKDFEDVFVVAKAMIDEIKNYKKEPNLSDIRRIIKDIKVNYPNLFINIDEYFKEINMMSFND